MKHTFWATIILLAILSTISASLGQAQDNSSGGILMNGGENNNSRSIDDIIQKVKEYRSDAILDAEAHLVSAEDHRGRDVRWGIATVALSALVSTAVVTGLAKQFTLGNGSTPWSWQTLVAVVISVPLVSAPILTAIYKSMHNAEDAASHNASATRYDRLARKYDLFLVQYTGADASKREEAIKALRELDTQYGNARENNITLTDEAIEKARLNLAKRQKANTDGKDTG
jgi:hypothetical protein